MSAVSQLWKSDFPQMSVWHCYPNIIPLILIHKAGHPKHTGPEFEAFWQLNRSSISATAMPSEGGDGKQGRWQLGEHQPSWWASHMAWQAAESWVIAASGVQGVDNRVQWLTVWTLEPDRSGLKPKCHSVLPTWGALMWLMLTNGGCPTFNKYFIHSTHTYRGPTMYQAPLRLWQWAKQMSSFC